MMRNFESCIFVFLVAVLKYCHSGHRPLCKTPTEPSHANVKYKKFDRNGRSRDGSKIIYRCKNGFQRIGSYRIFCQKDGTWTDQPPICISKYQIPKSISNGTMKEERRGKRLRVKYRCNEGYWMQGKARIVLSNGKWNRDPPVCIRKTCKEPRQLSNFKNGKIEKDDKNGTFDYLSTITFTCNDGYYDQRQDATDAMTCVDENTWKPSKPPYCSRQRCGHPGKPKNGHRVGSDFTIGASVEFECNPGYQLIGSNKMVCQSNGLWSGPAPVCDNGRFDCVDPGTPVDGTRNGDKFNIGDKVRFDCLDDFTLVGSEERICLRNNTWTGIQPTCEDDKNPAAIPSLNETADLFVSNVVEKLSPATCSSNQNGKCKVLRGRSISLNHPEGLDLIFLFDTSSSIGEQKFELSLKFACFLVRKFGIDYGPGGTRVAAITYSTKAYLAFNLGDNSVDNVDKACEEIHKIRYSGGGTATREGLKMIQDNMDLISEKAKAIILITDGRHNFGGSPIDIASELKRTPNVEIFTIGVGKGINREELSKIASKSTKKTGEHIFQLRKYDDFKDLMDNITNKDFGECGESALKQRGRILSGDPFADRVQWPWQAAIFRDNKMICGGSLIRNDVVITAAHCLLQKEKKKLLTNSYRVIVGEKNLILGDKAADDRRKWLETSGHKVQVIKHHPNYKFGEIDQDDYREDIALFQLEKPVKWSAKIRPICLPQKGDHLKDRPEKLQYGYVTGWGNTLNESTTSQKKLSPGLLHALLPVKDNKTCQETYFFKNKMFCAGYGKGIRDACRGDSGGPFAMKMPIDETRVKFRYKLMGIVSWGIQCGKYGTYGYYTRVTNYLDWIRKSLKELQQPFMF